VSVVTSRPKVSLRQFRRVCRFCSLPAACQPVSPPLRGGFQGPRLSFERTPPLVSGFPSHARSVREAHLARAVRLEAAEVRKDGGPGGVGER
jgi:hypothetical protein